MQSLTKKQKLILDFINSYIAENGISPTNDEIRKKFKLKAISTVHEHVNALKEKGYISKSDNLSRSIEPKIETFRVLEIPVMGSIAAGQPIEAIEDRQDTISIINPSIKNPKEYYALKVKGDSMIEEGIFDGDLVIIKKQSVAENGQTVVAVIDDNEATLKKLYREKDRFRLEPRNQSMLPFFRKEVEVRGVVVQIISNPKQEEEKKSQKKTKHGFKTIDLFAGIGGIRMGFEKAGFKTVFANDFDAHCKQTYDLNFKTSKLVVEDIRKVGIDDLPDFDCIFQYFQKIIKAKNPEGFMLENVKNLKSHDGGNTFKVIEETLHDLGYHVKAKVLNTMEYGNVPQNRERIYIVGFKNKDYCDKFEFPQPVKLTKKITDLLEKKVPEKYYYNRKPLFEKLKKDVKEEGKVYQWRRQYVRENKSGVCPTLTANMGMGGHNVPIIKDKKGIRKLTPRECARIQGFPDDFKLPNLADSALYKQFGNSVSVPVVEAVAKQMMKAME